MWVCKNRRSREAASAHPFRAFPGTPTAQIVTRVTRRHAEAGSGVRPSRDGYAANERYTASETLEKVKSATRRAGMIVVGLSSPRAGMASAADIASIFFRTATGLSFQRKLFTG